MQILKDLKREGITYQKVKLNNCHHQWKKFYDQSIDSDIKPYEEIRKLTAGQGQIYTTGC